MSAPSEPTTQQRAIDFVRRYDHLLLVAGLTVVAAVLRLWQLDSVPPGLHGDEGWTGIDARRVQAEGWIGPYVTSAVGQPTGPLYWAAAVLSITGHGVFAVRFSMALLGIAAIPGVYFAARAMFDRTTGVFAAALLVTLTWHLHYSRIGFMVISWPLFEVAAMALLFLALKRQRAWLYGFTGLVLGLGIYSYNVYPLFIVVTGLFALAAIAQSGNRWPAMTGRFALLFACSVLTALPLLLYVVDPGTDYFAHHRDYSVLHTDAYREAGLGGRVEILWSEARAWLGSMLWQERPDAVDAAGTRPMLDPLTALLVAGGLVVCLRRLKEPASLFLVFMLLLIPIAAIVSLEGGFRRTLGLAPAIAILAALPLAYAWHEAPRRLTTDRARLAARGAVIAAVLAFSLINLRAYEAVATSDFAEWVFAREYTAATRHIAGLNGDPYVYMLSPRHSFHYEIRRYLAPDMQGEDRSQQFGRSQSLEVDRNRDAVLVLIDGYQRLLPQLEAMYPEGRAHIENADGRTLFVAYFVPAAR